MKSGQVMSSTHVSLIKLIFAALFELRVEKILIFRWDKNRPAQYQKKKLQN